MKHNNFSQIPNNVLEKLITYDFTGTEFKIILKVIRQTFGYHKDKDWISLSQFQGTTGKSRRNISRFIRKLVSRKTLVKRSSPGKNAYYSINTDTDTWLKTGVRNGTTDTSVLKLVSYKTHTKDIFTKKKNFSKELASMKPHLAKEKRELSHEEKREFLNLLCEAVEKKLTLKFKEYDFKEIRNDFLGHLFATYKSWELSENSILAINDDSLWQYLWQKGGEKL